jgi:hypothetical protein
LVWADAHHAATGKWPSRMSGIVSAAPKETWVKLDSAMRQDSRGLGFKTSLARILAEHRGIPNPADPPPLTLEAIIAWADDHYRDRKLTRPDSGRVTAAPANTWSSITKTLGTGSRNLPAGMTIHKLLANRKPPRPRPSGRRRGPDVKSFPQDSFDAVFPRMGRGSPTRSRASSRNAWSLVCRSYLSGKRVWYSAARAGETARLSAYSTTS